MVHKRAVLVSLSFCLFLSAPLRAITRTWTGSVSANWSNSGNWSPSATPVTGDSLVFPAGAAHNSMTNDLPGVTSVGSMTFALSAYTLIGNALTLTADVTGDWQCGVDIKAGQSIRVQAKGFSGAVDVNGQTLTVTSSSQIAFTGPLNGSGAVLIDGITASFTGGDFAGTITGDLQVSGSMPNAEVAGGSLRGSGTVGAVRIDGSPNSDPTLARQLEPQIFGAPAALETKSLILNGAFINHANGSGATSTIKVTGTVTLSGDLAFSTIGVPVPGAAFEVIDNDGNDPIIGTFHQFGTGKPLPEGGTLKTADGMTFTISYQGGDGNDVVVTAPASGKKSWTGAVSALWSNPSNWSPTAIPVAGEELVFPSGGANQLMTNDLPPETNIGAMTFSGVGYTLSGNELILTGDAIETVGGGFQCNATLKLAQSLRLQGSRFHTVDVNGHTLTLSSLHGGVTFDGLLTGSGAVVIEGTEASLIGGDFTGTITGAVQLSGLMPNAEMLGGSLRGKGTVGTVRIDGSPTVDRTLARQLEPMLATVPSTLETKSLIMNGALLSLPDVSGPASTVKVTGTVTLAGDLGFSTIGVPAPGQSFVVIDNDGTDPITGTLLQFAIGKPLPEGATFTTADGKTFRITYRGGDGNDLVVSAVVPTSTALTQSSASTQFGQPFTLTATVSSSGTPTGTVVFRADGVDIGTAPLQSGVATLAVSTIEVGGHSITSAMNGTGVFGDSASNAVSHVVVRAPTSTAIVTNNPKILYGQTINFTISVNPLSPVGVQPGGMVTISSDGVSLGTAAVINGAASFSSSVLHGGPRSITATYAGDSHFEGSASTALQQIIGKAQTRIDTTTRSVLTGQPPVINVAVGVPGRPDLIPSGTVSISDDGTLLESEVLTGGAVTVALPPLSAGDHRLSVNFGGGSDFEESNTTVIQSVLLPSISFRGTRVVEGDRGVTAASVEVSLSAAVSVPVRISFSTLAGSATEGEDYEKTSGVVEFAPGETSHSIELHIVGDTLPEPDESFAVVLSDAVNATIGQSLAFVEIVNDDQVSPRHRASRH
jgi:hypothetical protein